MLKMANCESEKYKTKHAVQDLIDDYTNLYPDDVMVYQNGYHILTKEEANNLYQDYVPIKWKKIIKRESALNYFLDYLLEYGIFDN